MVENKYLVNNNLISILCYIPFVRQWQRSNVFCKSSQGFHTLLLVFWPIPPCRSPLDQWCFGAVAGQHGLSTPSKDFLWGWGHDVSTPMLHSRYGVLWMQLSILSPPNTTSWVFTKKFYFGFIWPYDILPILFWIIQMLSSKLQTGLDMYWLKQGDTSGTAGFESLAAQCVTDGSLCYFGPSSLQVIH